MSHSQAPHLDTMSISGVATWYPFKNKIRPGTYDSYTPHVLTHYFDNNNNKIRFGIILSLSLFAIIVFTALAFFLLALYQRQRMEAGKKLEIILKEERLHDTEELDLESAKVNEDIPISYSKSADEEDIVDSTQNNKHSRYKDGKGIWKTNWDGAFGILTFVVFCVGIKLGAKEGQERELDSGNIHCTRQQQ
jgi:hypothetical protein